MKTVRTSSVLFCIVGQCQLKFYKRPQISYLALFIKAKLKHSVQIILRIRVIEILKQNKHKPSQTSEVSSAAKAFNQMYNNF